MLSNNFQFLCIDVTDRDPDDAPSGIPYRLLAEGCLPNINTSDFVSIFEEHRVCKNLNEYLQDAKVSDIFVAGLKALLLNVV